MTLATVSWTASSFDPVLKTWYQGPINDLINNAHILAKRLGAKDDYEWDGNEIYIPLRVGRSEGQGWIGKGGILPDPQQQRYNKTRFSSQFGYKRFMFPGPDMAQSKTDRGSFARLMDSEITNGISDFEHDRNRQLWGNGSGFLARATAEVVATYNVDNPGGYTNPSTGDKYFRPGMVVVAIDPATGTARGTARTVVSTAAGTVTFDAALGGWVANDWLVTASATGVTPNATSHGTNRELMGLQGIVSDVDPPTRGGIGTLTGLQNLLVASEPLWKAIVSSNGAVNRNLTLRLLQQLEDRLFNEVDATPNALFSDTNQRLYYFELLEAGRRFVNTKTFDGGFDAVEFNRKPWFVDKDCVAGRIYMLKEQPLGFYRLEGGMRFMEKDGAILHRDNDRDLYQATLKLYEEFATENRRPSAVIVDLTP